MSTIVYGGEKVSEKRLLKETKYRYHSDSTMRQQIIKELEKHLNREVPDNVVIDINIDISLKEYDLNYRPVDKNQCYPEYSNLKQEESK